MSLHRPIPVRIDFISILEDLREAGWGDYKIEVACGLPTGWISKLRSRATKIGRYDSAARFYNFWVDQCSANSQTHAETT